MLLCNIQKLVVSSECFNFVQIFADECTYICFVENNAMQNCPKNAFDKYHSRTVCLSMMTLSLFGKYENSSKYAAFFEAIDTP